MREDDLQDRPFELRREVLRGDELRRTKKTVTLPPDTLNRSVPSCIILSETGAPSARSTSARFDTNGSSPFQLAARAPPVESNTTTAAARTATTLRAFAREKFVFLMRRMLTQKP